MSERTVLPIMEKIVSRISQANELLRDALMDLEEQQGMTAGYAAALVKSSADTLVTVAALLSRDYPEAPGIGRPAIGHGTKVRVAGAYRAFYRDMLKSSEAENLEVVARDGKNVRVSTVYGREIMLPIHHIRIASSPVSIPPPANRQSGTMKKTA